MSKPEHRRVLYAEDNRDACQMLTVLLNFSAIEVIAAGTIAEAWQLAQTGDFDLYLLDSRFPDGDGLELCRSLKEYAPRTPIIIYSGHAHENDIQKGLSVGANAYLVKPYIYELTELILQTIKPSKTPVAKSYDYSFLESQSQYG